MSSEPDDKHFVIRTSLFSKASDAVIRHLDNTAIWFREKVVEPRRGPKYPYYHQKFRRVPGIETCNVGDEVCIFEANEQFRRDKLVDNEILGILRQRKLECELYYEPDGAKYCKKVTDDYDEAVVNWFTKYGDLGAHGNAINCLMKQKHRMIWERRHGEVGQGMKGTQPH